MSSKQIYQSSHRDDHDDDDVTDILTEVKKREPIVDNYIANCKKYDVDIDPSVVISLLTKWKKLQPTKRFSEGDMVRKDDIFFDVIFLTLFIFMSLNVYYRLHYLTSYKIMIILNDLIWVD